jgi:hypothetical protein
MISYANRPVCIVRRLSGLTLFRTLNRGVLIGLFLLCLSSLFSCATTNSTTYEAQRRGLLMLEGENIYRNKGFYHSKSSMKTRKKAMRAHKKSLRR